LRRGLPQQAERRVQQQFAELLVKRRSQPALGAVEHRQRPEDHVVTLIMLAGKARQIKGSVQGITRFLGGT
jgi:hypothetical protein